MYTVGLYTLGCKVSQYETEAIAEAFEREGVRVLPFQEKCDIYVINTCTVTAESDRKSRQMIRRAISANPCAIVAVCGCYSQRSPSDIERIEGVSICIGTQDKLSVVPKALDMLNERRERIFSVNSLDGVCFEPMAITHAPRTRVYVKIEDGCESRCSYCAIADARGPVRSKPVDEVVREVEALAKNGTREVVLTGIETGSYGKDLGMKNGLAELIALLDKRGSCERIRLGSLAPELIGESFVNTVKDCKILAPHFHMSMQSGSDKILNAMRRKYSSEMALKNIMRIKEAIPDAQFTTDMMVGFPGESDEDFSETVEFVRKVGFIDVHVFAYSRRKNTPAATYDGQIDEAVKKQRSAQLIKEKNLVRDCVLEKIVKSEKVLSCILESERDGVYTAHSDEYFEVNVKALPKMEGEMVKVLPVSHKNGIITGKLI